jgi:heme exporter protein B
MSSARDLLAPLLLLPLSIPLVIAAAGAASPVLEAGGPGFERYGTWLAVLGLYDVIFCAIGFAVFDYLLDE